MVERYAELLATTGVVRGLIGPREAPRLWDRHLLNSVVLAERLPLGATVCDVGSGAGLPGLVVAIARADLTVTLVEPLLRRTTFLEEVVLELGLSNVEVVRGRAEVLHGVREFDVVTSRAVAPLPQLLAWSMPLVGAHGVLLALKGASAADELAAAEMDLQRWGCAAPEVVELGVGVVSSPAHAVRVAWADPTAVRWPPTDGARGRSSTRPQNNSRKQRRSHG